MRKTGCPQIAQRCRRRLGRFGRDEAGATAVEFAMVSVPFLGLLFAIFQTAFIFFAQEGLEAATADAGRFIMTGQALAQNYTSATDFRQNVICNPAAPRKLQLPSFIPCSSLIVDVRSSSASGFSSVNVSKDVLTASPQYCIGPSGSIVVLRVLYPMPAYLSILAATSLGSVSKSTTGQTNYNGQMTNVLMATAAFRNEPFPGTYVAPSGC